MFWFCSRPKSPLASSGLLVLLFRAAVSPLVRPVLRPTRSNPHPPRNVFDKKGLVGHQEGMMLHRLFSLQPNSNGLQPSDDLGPTFQDKDRLS